MWRESNQCYVFCCSVNTQRSFRHERSWSRGKCLVWQTGIIGTVMLTFVFWQRILPLTWKFLFILISNCGFLRGTKGDAKGKRTYGKYEVMCIYISCKKTVFKHENESVSYIGKMLKHLKFWLWNQICGKWWLCILYASDSIMKLFVMWQ